MSTEDAIGSTPRVSVVMPTYKRPQMLREALASAVGQTLRELEVIVCDNADDPETRAVVESFHDDRITYVGRPTNIGMIANALDGFRRARGDLVIKLDDDDALVPHALETLAAPFEHRPELTASFCDLELVDPEGRRLEEQTQAVQRDTGREGLRPGIHAPATEIAVRGAVSLSGALLRRSAVDWDAVPEEAGTSYDFYLTLSAAADGGAAWYTPQELVRYRIHGANDSVKNVVPSLEASVWILEDARRSGRHQDGPCFRTRLAQDRARLAREHLVAGDRSTAVSRAVSSLRDRPSRTAATALLLACLPGEAGSRIVRRRREDYLRSAADAAPAPRP